MTSILPNKFQRGIGKLRASRISQTNRIKQWVNAVFYRYPGTWKVQQHTFMCTFSVSMHSHQWIISCLPTKIGQLSMKIIYLKQFRKILLLLTDDDLPTDERVQETVVLVRSQRILHEAVSALTMSKLTNFSMENENDAMLSGKYI